MNIIEAHKLFQYKRITIIKALTLLFESGFLFDEKIK